MWALIFAQGPLSSFTVYDLSTATKVQLSGVDPQTINPDEHRRLYLQKYDGEFHQNILMGFRKGAAKLVSENDELTTKISKKEKGYGASNQDRIAIEFNEWFREFNPDIFQKSFLQME